MSPVVFILIAAAAAAVALAFIVLPLLRAAGPRRALQKRLAALDELKDELDPADWQARRERIRRKLDELPGGKRPLALILAVAFAVPLATVLIYRTVGTPEGLEPATGHAAEAREVLSDLAARVRRDPEDAEAWATMGMIWKDLQQFPAAEAALRRVERLEPDNPYVKVELAEVLLFNSGRPHMPEPGRRLLEQAVGIDPDNQKALWLLGVTSYQGGEYERALAYWERLETVLPEGSVRDQVREQIERARFEIAHADDPAAAHPPIAQRPGPGIIAPPATATDITGAAPSITAEVSIDPQLAARLRGNETLFVFARATGGPPMPVAVRRMRARDLPAEIRLTNADGMVEGLGLSDFAEVELVARVTAAGDVTARPGDLEGTTGPVRPADHPRVRIAIDRVIE